MKKNKTWIDILLVLALMLLVYLACQPLGRSWDEGMTEMFTGTEGVYSPDTDSYYYLRKAKEFTENGFGSIRFICSRPSDPLITTVQSGGSDWLPTFSSAFAAILWYLLHAIGIKVGIYALAIHLAAFILSLCVIPLYCFLRKRVSRAAAAFGALTATVAPAYLRHALTGFFDTDTVIALFALITVLGLYECILAKKRGEQIRYAVITVCGTLLLALTWKVFYVYVAIAIGTGLAAVCFVRWFLLKKTERTISMLVPLLTMAVMMGITVIIGYGDLVGLVKGFFAGGGETELWPAASQNVGELVRPHLMEPNSFWEIFMTTPMDYVSYLGGIYMTVFLLVSIVIGTIAMIRIKRGRTETEDRERPLVLYFAIAVWFAGTAFLCFFGIRYVELLILPAALILGFGFSYAERFLKSGKLSVTAKRAVYIGLAFMAYSVLMLMFPKLAMVAAGVILVAGFFLGRFEKGYGILALLFVTLLLGSVSGAYLRAAMERPLLEKPTEEAMQWIRDNTAEDAVVADFWSWGYLYQYYAERRSVSDGGTYNGEFCYWLGTMLLTDDLKLSAGITRMLQNSGLDGTNYAVELCGGKQKACDMLKEILVLNRADAEELLKSKYPFAEDERTKLLDHTHPLNCPDIYLVTNYDSLRVSATMALYPNWDFSGKEFQPVATLFSQQSVPRPEEGEKTAALLWKRGIASGWNVQYSLKDGELSAKMGSPDGRLSDFPRMLYIKNGELVYDRTRTEPEEGCLLVERQALIILEENGRLSAVMADETLVNTTLYRLYLRDGADQTVFEKVYEADIPERISGERSKIQRRIGTKNTRDYTNCGIVVWKVHFE